MKDAYHVHVFAGPLFGFEYPVNCPVMAADIAKRLTAEDPRLGLAVSSPDADGVPVEYYVRGERTTESTFIEVEGMLPTPGKLVRMKHPSWGQVAGLCWGEFESGGERWLQVGWMEPRHSRRPHHNQPAESLVMVG